VRTSNELPGSHGFGMKMDFVVPIFMEYRLGALIIERWPG
jgi:hypothetical protein